MNRCKRVLNAVFGGGLDGSKVEVACDLEVTPADGAVYVKGFHYRIAMVAPDRGQINLTFKTEP